MRLSPRNDDAATPALEECSIARTKVIKPGVEQIKHHAGIPKVLQFSFVLP
jgi:hypothetical protein